MSSGSTNISDVAFAKILLHACRWSHLAISGILLGRVSGNKDGGNASIEIKEAVPLFHQQLGLAPMLTVALTQIEQRYKQQGMQVVGYYQANENMKDIVPDFIAKKITEKIAENNDMACLIMVDNMKIGVHLDTAPIIVSHVTHDGKWKTKDKHSVKLDSTALESTSELIRKRLYHDINDFDLHLDDLKCDWANTHINDQLSR